MGEADRATSPVSRPLPVVSLGTEAFWTGGRNGELVVKRCPRCGRLHHPSMVLCPDCPGSVLDDTVAGGTGTIVGLTTNVQPWHPGLTPPYVIAIVALDDDPRVRLTTNIVGDGADDAAVGDAVAVTFENHGDVWLPLFVRTGAASMVDALAPLPDRTARESRPIDKFEDRVVITGIGQSQIGRRLGRHPLSLTVEACLAAIDDAGLTLADIDGLSTYPGPDLGGGFSEGGVAPVVEALGIRPTWHSGGPQTSGQTGSVVNGMLAVASGLCRHVLCFRTVWEATHTQMMRDRTIRSGSSGRAIGFYEWTAPYGAMSAANWIAMTAAQYAHRFGLERETLGRIAINARANAARNPVALLRDPMSMDDYLSARMITTPFGLYDCDFPCDGAVAVIVSSIDTAADLRHAPVLVDAVGTAVTERQSWDQGTITYLPNVFGPASHLWTRTDLRPDDVDVAELYDGFTFNTVSWLEALGFCDVGGAADFIGDGSRIALGGELPLNTHGGQLSAGRTHGYGFLHEAVVQLRGDAGSRQVPDAAIAAVAAGGGTPGGAFLLRKGTR